MRITIDRRWKKEGYTISAFIVNGRRFCETLEDKDRGLKQDMPLSKIQSLKVYGKTAIPTGTYKVILSVSEKFKGRAWAKKYGGLVPEILDVKGFSGVRIHPGNQAEDTQGCPIIGENKVKGKVINSTACYYRFMDLLVPAIDAKEEIILVIK